MNAFRRRDKNFVSPVSLPPVIREVVSASVVENGVDIVREHVVTRTDEEYHQTHPISMEDYSINEQISAGVSLKEIPVSGMLDSSDNLDYAENDTAEEQILEQLKNIETNE